MMERAWKILVLIDLVFTQKKLVEPIGGPDYRECIGAGEFWAQVVKGGYLLRTTSRSIA